MNSNRSKAILVLIWALALLVFTCTENLNNLLLHGKIEFIFDPHPNILQFFNFTDLSRIHHVWIVVKFGHFVGFGLLDLLIFNWLRRRSTSLTLSILFAFATEVLQLYLDRDGRLYDILIDSAGVWSAALITSRWLHSSIQVSHVKK